MSSNISVSKRQKEIAPSRKSKKHIGGYFDEAVYRQMKHLGVERGMTTQEILTEALNRFFQRNNKPCSREGYHTGEVPETRL